MARTLVLGAAVIVLGLLLAEGLCRLWLPLGEPLLRLDETLLHVNRRAARSMHILDEANGGDWIQLRTNDHGLRGAALLPRGQELRVAVYGDSFVFAGNAREEETFVARLGVELERELERPVEALNAGVTGYGPDQALLKFEGEQEALDPDLIVLCLCAHNDHGDLVRNRLFDLDGQGELRRLRPTLAPELVSMEAERTAGSGSWIVTRLFAASGASARPLPERDLPYLAWYLRATRAEYLLTKGTGQPQVLSLFEDYWDADLALEPDSASASHKRSLMVAVLARFQATCTERGIPLFAVVIPADIDAADGHPLRVDRALYPRYERRALTNALGSALEQSAIPHTDLFETLCAAGGDWAFHLEGDFHWSPRGQEAAAKAVAPALAAAFSGTGELPR
ncbi:MAG: SGNH/GDSL hydrolase family protein [Planctomycetota bacterium]|nr:SGNH/GDSL hydrolase family protein [Planctomycetota bacterium]